jgi:8-oxo-dGTP pyrophosphatase MutT (NUDIX family)
MTKSRLLLNHRHIEQTNSTCSERAVAAVVLLREDNAALLQHRDDKPGLRHAGMWVPPGGHCEPDEAMESCARREMREETGYECDNLNWLISFEDGYAEGWPSYPLTVFWAWYDGVQSVRCMEGQALQFVERNLTQSHPMPPYLIEVWDLAIAAASKEKFL